jgi:hypothetical protein
MTTAAPAVYDQKVMTGSCAGSAGTATFDFAVPTNRAVRLRAQTELSATSPFVAGSIYSECVVKNAAGTLSFPVDAHLSLNPIGSLGSTWDVQCADATLTFGSPPSSCIWSISGTNARLTVTNQGSVTADVTVFILSRRRTRRSTW